MTRGGRSSPSGLLAWGAAAWAVASVAVAGAGCAPGLPDRLARPNRVALGPDGTVYVSDFQHDRIVTFDPDGRFLGAFAEQGIGKGQLWRVMAMAVARDGTLLVANRRPESEELKDQVRFEVVRFRDGEEVGRTLLGEGALQADGWVDGVAEVPDGDLVIADGAHGELIEIDAAGRRVGKFGGVMRVDAAPSGLRRDGDTMWVVEQYRHRVSRLLPGGVEVPLELDDAGHGGPRFPSAVGVCSGRWVAIADLAGHRVQRYDLDGKWLGEIVPDPVGPDQPVQLVDLEVAADCSRLYLVDSKGDRVLVTTPEGAALTEITAW